MENNKRIMIIGASILQLPAILKAKELGFNVAVVDYNPEAIGVKYADKYFNYSTNDIEGVTEVAKEYKPDGIMTLATDMPMRTIASATKECGLPGIDMETAIRSTDKGEMIKAFENANVEHPWYKIVKIKDELNEIIKSITYPCIIKPIDGSGSRGVFRADTEDELLQAYKYTYNESKSGDIIIEEFLSGKEVSVEIISINDCHYVLQVTDKETTGAPYFVEIGHNQPSTLKKDDLNNIKDLAIRAARALGIKSGPAHAEIMLTSKGPKMIEIGARMGGDCITTHLVPLSTGIDMVKATLDLCCGVLPDINVKFDKGSAIRYFKTDCGILRSIEGIDDAMKIEGVKEIQFVYDIGDQIDDIKNSSNRIGFVIAQANSADEAKDICERAINKIRISVL